MTSRAERPSPGRAPRSPSRAAPRRAPSRSAAEAPELRALHPSSWPRPRGYSNGFAVPAGSELVFTAGMVGWDERERIVQGGFVAQFEQALRNVLAVVGEAGGGPEHVVRMTAYVVEKREYLDALPSLGEAWRRTMGRNYPAMALVQVAGLVEDGARVEIEAVAAIRGPRA